MLVSGSPCTLLWPAAMIVWGPGHTSSGHSHHSLQLVMGLRGGIRIRGGPSDAWIRCAAALVRPDSRHEVDARGTEVLIGFVDPESELGTTLAVRLTEDITPIGPAEAARWRHALGDPAALTSTQVERWLREQLLAGKQAPRIHPGVRRALRFVRQRMGTPTAFTLPELGQAAGLSPSRFRHVFAESVGVPVRPYILWLRLQRSCGELMKGASVTEAAHAAGFSDAAHMARTFRRMLGTTPSELAGRRVHSRGVFVQSA